MSKIPLCDLGKLIKKRLVDLDHNQVWLIEQVHRDTGLYFDDSYLCKILNGKISTPKIIASICKILNIENPNDATSQGQNSA